MGGRVIKINLMGAIFTIIIIIAVIVGTVILVTKFIPKNANGNETTNNNSTQNNSNEIDVNKMYTENVLVDGQKKEVTMKYYKSNLNYAMKFDVDIFYIDISKENVDQFKSKYTDLVYLNITKEKTNYSEKVNELNKKASNEVLQNSTYTIKETKVNNKTAVRAQKDDMTGTLITYIIEAKDGCYAIDIQCGKELKNTMIPIIEKMVESFIEI